MAGPVYCPARPRETHDFANCAGCIHTGAERDLIWHRLFEAVIALDEALASGAADSASAPSSDAARLAVPECTAGLVQCCAAPSCGQPGAVLAALPCVLVCTS
jgi:hypothetical protein